MFETPENFAAMVQRDWPMLLSPKEVTFLESIDRKIGKVAGAI